AAGRPAERNAAETTASAKAEAPMAPQAARAAEAPMAPGAAPPPPPEPEVAQDKAMPSDGKIAPKASRRDMAPPPPPPTQSITREVAPNAAAAPTGGAKDERERAVDVEGGAAGGGGGGATGGKIGSLGLIGGANGGSGASTLIRTKRDDIAKCWAGQQVTLTVRVVIKANGTASTTLSSKGKITPEVEACVKKVVGAIEFPAKADSVSITVGS
ncbi:MAG: hypothetical protein HOV81_33560, partial [Kofleriaceae bacterium]|nr:hypothetical protein [Kofleriaceae bacterium]